MKTLRKQWHGSKMLWVVKLVKGAKVINKLVRVHMVCSPASLRCLLVWSLKGRSHSANPPAMQGTSGQVSLHGGSKPREHVHKLSYK